MTPPTLSPSHVSLPHPPPVLKGTDLKLPSRTHTPSINACHKARGKNLNPSHRFSSFLALLWEDQMGKKLSLSSFLFRLRDSPKPSCYFSSPPPPSWPWPSCRHPRTSSFRDVDGGAIYKTVNSVYFDSTDSFFTRSSEEQESFSTASEDSDGDSVETVVRGLRSDRLFFRPGETSSILEEAKTGELPFKDSVVLAMESEDPYRDFRLSMEEMVVAHGLRDWERLEELLEWYLRVNGKKTHGFIVGAFVDLLAGFASPLPSSFSPSKSMEMEEIKEEEGSRSS